MPKKIKIVRKGTPSGAWMVTFSDMNTLLLTFFVLLFSMSTISTDRFDEIFKPNEGDELGLLSEESFSYVGKLIFDPMPDIRKNPMRSALAVFSSTDSQQRVHVNVPDGVEFFVSEEPNGVMSIVIADRVLFTPGQTELTEDSRAFLDLVKEFLRRLLAVMPRRVIVEGHTDNTAPVEERYIISARRAESVLEYLLQDQELPPELFSMVGYGSAKPRVPNNSDFNRARNRRVRILIEPPDEAGENVLF